MDLNLLGKRALVCGSSQGIGRACAEQLADLGASVVLFSRDREKLDKVREQLNTSAGQTHTVLLADFAQPAQVKTSVERLLAESGPCEILVNNTGGPAPGRRTVPIPRLLSTPSTCIWSPIRPWCRRCCRACRRPPTAA
ncbi:SDR family NAD(P)-dependent oxidoreductase [Microbulbifer taiwanensis]|uniref:SDR family NAD(P)-dependent oxidoreductase n=1 Tax=Microbulbifer taiwanensis TaxID=986746 RepID=UPI00360E1B87